MQTRRRVVHPNGNFSCSSDFPSRACGWFYEAFSSRIYSAFGWSKKPRRLVTFNPVHPAPTQSPALSAEARPPTIQLYTQTNITQRLCFASMWFAPLCRLTEQREQSVSRSWRLFLHCGNRLHCCLTCLIPLLNFNPVSHTAFFSASIGCDWRNVRQKTLLQLPALTVFFTQHVWCHEACQWWRRRRVYYGL